MTATPLDGADPDRASALKRKILGRLTALGATPALERGGARFDADLVGERDREVPVAVEQPASADDRHPHDLSVGVVAHAVTLGGQRCVGGFGRLAAREVEHVAIRVVVGAVEDEPVDLDAHGIHPAGDLPCHSRAR